MASIGLAWAQGSQMYRDEERDKEALRRYKAESKLIDMQRQYNEKQAEYLTALNEPKFKVGKVVADNQAGILMGSPESSLKYYASLVEDPNLSLTVSKSKPGMIDVVDRATGKVTQQLPILSGEKGLYLATSSAANSVEQAAKVQAQIDAQNKWKQEIAKIDRTGYYDLEGKKIGAQATLGAAGIGANAAITSANIGAAAGIQKANIDAVAKTFGNLMSNPDSLPLLVGSLSGISLGSTSFTGKEGTALSYLPGLETMTPEQQTQFQNTYMGVLSGMLSGNPNLMTAARGFAPIFQQFQLDAANKAAADAAAKRQGEILAQPAPQVSTMPPAPTPYVDRPYSAGGVGGLF